MPIFTSAAEGDASAEAEGAGDSAGYVFAQAARLRESTIARAAAMIFFEFFIVFTSKKCFLGVMDNPATD